MKARFTYQLIRESSDRILELYAETLPNNMREKIESQLLELFFKAAIASLSIHLAFATTIIAPTVEESISILECVLSGRPALSLLATQAIEDCELQLMSEITSRVGEMVRMRLV